MKLYLKLRISIIFKNNYFRIYQPSLIVRTALGTGPPENPHIFKLNYKLINQSINPYLIGICYSILVENLVGF